MVGTGRPLVHLCGSTPNHRNPKPGWERRFTLASVLPLVRAGFEVWFTNRWPGMPTDISFAEVAAGHADALAAHFGEPVDVLGHSTGGSLALQLIADRPEVVRRCVVASAAYTLGPVARRAQRSMLRDLRAHGRYTASSIAEGLEGMLRPAWIRSLVTPLLQVVSRRIMIENPSDAIAMLAAEDAFDVRDRLEQIQTETLVVCGARDHFWTPEMFTETAYRMPHGKLIMYPHRGHALLTAPEFVRDVSAFLP